MRSATGLGPLARALALVLVVSAAGCSSGNDPRDLEDFVERWKLLYNSHDLPGFTALYAPEGAYTAPGMVYFARSPAELRTALEFLWRGYPDMRIFNVHSIVASNGKIAFGWELARTPRTKRRQILRGATFLRLENGKIVHQQTYTLW